MVGAIQAAGVAERPAARPSADRCAVGTDQRGHGVGAGVAVAGHRADADRATMAGRARVCLSASLAVAVDGNPAFGHARSRSRRPTARVRHASMVRLVRVDRHRLAIVRAVRKQRHASRWLAACRAAFGETRSCRQPRADPFAWGLNRRLNRGCTGRLYRRLNRRLWRGPRSQNTSRTRRRRRCRAPGCSRIRRRLACRCRRDRPASR